MTENLSLDPKQGYARLFPAIGSFYCHVLSQWEKKLAAVDSNGNLKYPNRNPSTLSPDAKELYFLNENNGAFHYNNALYSAGHASIFDLQTTKIKEKVVLDRDRAKTTIIADSGGFQIASGASGASVSKFDWTDPTSSDNDAIRLAVLRWMENTADYSMMLDVPTAAIGNPRAKSITSFADCINMTRYNSDFFVKHRVPGATKILNVLQGRTQEEADIWWDVFKDDPFEGWAFAGANVGNTAYMLRRLITMRDNKYIGGDKNWLHVLGSSRLSTSCILTEIQRAIRSTVDDKFTISYDSATPFIVSAKGFVYSYDVFDAKSKKSRFSYLTTKMMEHIDAVGSTRPFPFSSVPGKFLTLGDICCRDPKISGTKTTWDSFSYVLLMWHNLYRQIQSTQTALRLYDMPSSQVRELVPSNLLEFKDLCKDIFASESPMDLINKHRTLLTSLTGIGTKSGKRTLLQEEGGSLFSWDDDSISEDDLFFDPSEGRESDLVQLSEEE